MKDNSDIRRKILQVSSLLIGIGLLGCCITLNIEALHNLVGIFALIVSAGCIGMILYSTLYVVQKLRENRGKLMMPTWKSYRSWGKP